MMAVRPEADTLPVSDRVQLRHFAADLSRSGWQVGPSLHSATMVCLRIERRVAPGLGYDHQCLEICRRTFAEVAACLRRHIAYAEPTIES